MDPIAGLLNTSYTAFELNIRFALYWKTWTNYGSFSSQEKVWEFSSVRKRQEIIYQKLKNIFTWQG